MKATSIAAAQEFLYALGADGRVYYLEWVHGKKKETCRWEPLPALPGEDPPEPIVTVRMHVPRGLGPG